jgi:hypothetical protein
VDVCLRSAVTGVLLALVGLLSACGSLQFRQQDDSEERARQLEQVQLRVMRFADEYVGQIMGPLNALQIRASGADERLDAQNWKVTQSTAAYINASHSNPVAGTMDMIVLAVLSRMVVEHDQRTASSRLRSPGLLEAHQKLERSAWELGSSIMDEEQKGHLRNAILTWRAANPEVRAVALVHFTDVSQILASDEKTFMSRGLLGFISIDATWGLDPAVREIAQTRQVVQQSMYYAQRAPSLLDMQVERLAYQLLATPENRLLLRSVDRTGDAAQRVGQLADAIPSMVAQEREAAIAQIVTQLGAQQARTRALVQDLHAMLDAGALASESINTTVQSIDSLVARFKPLPAQLPGGGASGSATKPSAISQYAEALRQLGRSTQELQKLLTTIDESSGGVSSVVHSATADAKSLAQYLVVLVILLAFSLASIIVAAVLALRLIPRRVRATHD